MIARVWLGSTAAALADDYAGYLDRTGVPDLAATEGNLGVLVLRRVGPDTAVFTVISLWEDMEAVRRFAGADPDRAVYYPEDAEYLLEMPPTLQHHDVTAAVGLERGYEPPSTTASTAKAT